MSVEASVPAADTTSSDRRGTRRLRVMLALIAIGPFVAYPFFVMQALCFALFACAFNLLIGYVGLLSFGHAMFLGMASYVSAHAAKVWGLEPDSPFAAASRRRGARVGHGRARDPQRQASISR